MSYEWSEGDGVVRRNNTEVSEVRKPVDQQRDKSKFGDCYIFDYQEFGSVYERRRGSENDVERLRKDFIGLNFNVFNFLNLTKKQTLEVLEEAANQDYECGKCFVCCFLTHENEGKLLMGDGEFLEVDNILKRFARSACKSLAGKPKIFIFQACRGKRVEEGINNFPKRYFKHYAGNPFSIPDIPDYRDFLLVYSSSKGFVSFRDGAGPSGTFFIDEMCRTLEQFSEKSDLLEILTIVNFRVARLFECKNRSMEHKKQMPCFSSTLTSKVKFDKKIPAYKSPSTELFVKRRMESPLGIKSEENPFGDKKQYEIQKPNWIKFIFLVNMKDNFDKPLLEGVHSLWSSVTERGYQSKVLSNWSKEKLADFLKEG